jgi:hypothetical protein
LPWIIEVKTPDEIEKMKAAGRVAREVLDIAGRAVRVGITTDEIDTIVHEETLKVTFVCLFVSFWKRHTPFAQKIYSTYTHFVRSFTQTERSVSISSQLPWLSKIMLYFGE